MSRAHKIRHILLSQQAELLARYHDALDLADHDLDSLELEDAKLEAEQWYAHVVSVLGDASMRALGDVISALERLDNGTYGVCTECGDRIDEAQLGIDPATRYCADCEVTERAVRAKPHTDRKRRVNLLRTAAQR